MTSGQDLYAGQTILPNYFVQEQAPESAFSQALTNFINAHSGPCRLFSLTVTNTNAAAQNILIFDTGIGALPANTTVPTLPLKVAAAATYQFNWGPVGRWMLQGLVIANSSTVGTLTVGAADCWFDVQVAP